MASSVRTNLKLLIILSLSCVLMLGSCTVYYTTSDLKKTFNQTQREVNKSLGKIAKDRREKSGIYTQLLAKVPDSTATPYPALSAELIVMARSFKQLKQTAKQLEQMKANFSRLVKGRKKIESGSSMWDDFQVIKAEYETQTGNFESQAESYNKSSNKFISLLNDHKITKLEVVEITKQIDDYMKELSHAIGQIVLELDEYRKKPDADKAVLNDLETILASIKADQLSLQKKIKAFKKEVGSEPQVWSGPGVLSFTILEEMHKLGDKISDQGEAFNKRAAKL